MSIPFTASLRTRAGGLRLGTGNEPVLTIRVEVPDVWDTIRVEAPADTPVAVVKERALQALMPDELVNLADFVMKLAGWEVLDEQVALSDAGARNGSIFLLTNRRRRPLR